MSDSLRYIPPISRVCYLGILDISNLIGKSTSVVRNKREEMLISRSPARASPLNKPHCKKTVSSRGTEILVIRPCKGQVQGKLSLK